MENNERITQLKDAIDKLKDKYMVARNHNQEEEATKIRKMMVLAIEKLNSLEKEEQQNSEINTIAENVKINEDKHQKYFDYKSHNMDYQNEVKVQFKVGTFVMTILLLILSLVSIFQTFIYDYLFKLQLFSTENFNYILTERFLVHIYIIILFIIFTIYLINVPLVRKKGIAFLGYLSLIVLYPTYGGITFLGLLDTNIITNGKGFSALPGLFLLVTCYLLFKNWYRREKRVIVK